MWKKQIFLVMLVISVFPVVLAESEYRNIGGTDYDFLQGDGAFNEVLSSSTQSRTVVNGKAVPLVANLDNSGVQEIIVIDGDTIRLFQNTSLGVLDSFLIPGGLSENPRPIIADIDMDGFLEILVPNSDSRNVTILEFNGTDFFIDLNIDFSGALVGGTAISREFHIGCELNNSVSDVPECLLVHTFNDAGAGVEIVEVVGFNSTTVGSSTNLQSLQANGVCMSKVPVISSVDYDEDGTDEFVFSYMILQDSTTDQIDIHFIEVDDVLTITNEVQITRSGINPSISDGANGCSENRNKYFTSPVVGDFQGAGGGLETVFGVMESANDFKIFLYDSAGSEIDDYPEATSVEGTILGNPMAANVFGDTTTSDFCVFGFDDVDEVISLICASPLTAAGGFLAQNIRFGFDSTGLFNYSVDYNIPTTIAHMANMKIENVDIDGTGLIDTDELIIGHGVFQLSEESSGIFFETNELDRIFVLNDEKACIPIQYVPTLPSDLICLGDTLLTYVNDNLINRPAAIQSFTENPCIDAGAVGINSTLQVTITAIDQNDPPLAQDLVTTRVTLYVGTPNVQISIIDNQTSGSQVVHLFEFPNAANATASFPGGINTTGVVTMTYEAFDTEFPSTIDTITQTFTVGNSGNTFGDCISGQTIISDVIDTNATLTSVLPQTQTNNAVTNAMIVLGNLFGLSGNLVWLIIMVSFAIAFWSAVLAGQVSGNSALGAIAIMEVLLLIIGTFLGFLSTSLVIIIAAIGAIIIAVFIGKFITGVTGNTQQ